MSQSAPSQTGNAKFVTGSTMRHILVMTSTSGIGLIAIFVVDLVDLYFLSLLGDEAIVAAIGYAATVLSYNIAIGVGLMIAASALVARAIGAEDSERARRYAVNVSICSAIIAACLFALVWPFLGACLSLLGAEGKVHDIALRYLQICFISQPVIIFSILSTGMLRAMGDARRAMNVALAGAATNLVLDPIFIFGLSLNVEGAAIATVIARIVAVGVGWYGVIFVHRLMAYRPTLSSLQADITPIMLIAGPALLTNLASPVGQSFVTALVAPFGEGAMAGWAIICVIIPVAFGGLYALSGAVGPILGQNLGARKFDRLRGTIDDALKFTLFYVALIWLLLGIANSFVADLFQVQGEAAELVRIFCLYVAPLFLFFGALYVCNAAFNNLGRAHYSSMFNWARATIGTVPLAYLGGVYFGAVGVVAGSLVGTMIFGSLAVFICYRLIDYHANRPLSESERLS